MKGVTGKVNGWEGVDSGFDAGAVVRRLDAKSCC